MGTWWRQQKARVPLGFWFHPWMGAETCLTHRATDPVVYRALLQVDPLTEEQHIIVQTPLPIKGGLRICSIHPPLPRLKFPCCLSEMPVCSKGAPAHQPTALEMRVLPGSVECADPPDTPLAIPVAAPAACRVGGRIPADAGNTDGPGWDNPSTGTAFTTQPNTDTIWMEVGMNCGSLWSELGVVWLVVTPESWGD